jgi:hypothetical protein
MISFFLGKINKSPLNTPVYVQNTQWLAIMARATADKLKPETTLDDAIDLRKPTDSVS